MAVNDPIWSYGGSILINSSGATTDPQWSFGQSVLYHEYVSGGAVAPTSTIYGPLMGPLGGPI